MLRDDATHASSASIAAAIDAILDSIVADAVRKAATDDAQAPAAPTTDAAPDDGTPTDDECPVCFAPMASTVKTIPPCGHAVCLRCLLRLRDRRGEGQAPLLCLTDVLSDTAGVRKCLPQLRLRPLPAEPFLLLYEPHAGEL